MDVAVNVQPGDATMELSGTGNLRNAAKQQTRTKYGLHSQIKVF
jgi:hypothetical protein